MFKLNKRYVAVAVAAAVGASGPAMASSEGTGFINGTSVTAQGTNLSNVTITIKNQETGLTRSVESDADGSFRFPLLPPGVYSVEASKEGFALSRQDKLRVGVSGKTNITITMNTSSDIERIEVTGTTVASFDVTSSESVTVVDQELIARVPVARDISAVTLLAPGTSQGDGSFGNGSAIDGHASIVSFGGASAAENSFFVNGLNITNFRNGVGGNSVPFEMYDTFEVKTGGYSAEFGRAIGGVVNATTKRGSNDFQWGANVYYEPDSLRGDRPRVFQDNGNLHVVNNDEGRDTLNGNIWASGAFIKDKFFYYVLFNPRSVEAENEQASTLTKDKSSSSFYGGKFDFYITPEHLLEATIFSDNREIKRDQWNVDSKTRENQGYRGQGIFDRGGLSYMLKYTGIITDDFTASISYGKNESDRSEDNADPNTALTNDRDTGVAYGNYVVGFFERGVDERDVLRLDFEYFIGDHTIKFGYDNEDLSSDSERGYPGRFWYRYQEDRSRVRVRENYQAQSTFETDSKAYYISDVWQVTDDIVATIGLRNEEFTNYNASGQSFISIDNQLMPRVGVAWDVNGDGESKLFANFGRYYIPVPTNTNIRVAGSELFTQKVCDVVSIDDAFVPTYENCGRTSVFGDGTQKGTLEVVDANVDPMYQDEYILGYEFNINDDWSAGVKVTRREVGVALEDIAIDAGFERYLQREFGASCTICSGFHYYVLTNPGNDLTITTDPDGDGPLANQQYTVPASDLGYPEVERKYTSVDLTVNRAWDGEWMLYASYSWSKSYGNNEGFLRSDNGQDDAGITTNFDQPGLVDGAYGNLPNDRRHKVKVYGAYALSDKLTAGANFALQSGRPKNVFGVHPTDDFAALYGAASFYQNGKLVPRGSLGNLPTTWQLDLSLSYLTNIGDYELELRGDVYNIFDNDKVLELEEVAEFSDGTADPDFGLIDRYQSPRYVRLSASIRF